MMDNIEAMNKTWDMIFEAIEKPIRHETLDAKSEAAGEEQVENVKDENDG